MNDGVARMDSRPGDHRADGLGRIFMASNRHVLLKRAVLVVVACAATSCVSYPDPTETRRVAEKMVSEDFSAPRPELLKRLVQDRSQQICSKIEHAPLTQEEAAEVVKLARDSIRYPQSGKLAGDWKTG